MVEVLSSMAARKASRFIAPSCSSSMSIRFAEEAVALFSLRLPGPGSPADTDVEKV